MCALARGALPELGAAEGRCKGSISGRLRGANFPRRSEGGTFRPDVCAVIETDDGATIMLEWHGYGRAHPVGRRQIDGRSSTRATTSATAD